MKHITIDNPIWKDRSVGLNVGGLDPKEEVTVDISYIEKGTGKRMFPGHFIMTVAEIHKFPTKNAAAGVKLHLVPITTLQDHIKLQVSGDPLKDLTVVDNYECARALDKFHRSLMVPLTERVNKGWDYLVENTGKNIPTKEKEKQQALYDTLKIQLGLLDDMYTATKALISRHEMVVTELSRIYVGLRENFLVDGKFPAELMTEQVNFMMEYYNSLEKMLKNIEL